MAWRRIEQRHHRQWHWPRCPGTCRFQRAVAPCIIRPSAPMILIMKNKQVLVFCEKKFQLQWPIYPAYMKDKQALVVEFFLVSYIFILFKMNPTRQGLNQLLKIWILCLFCKSVISSYYICQFCYFCNKWFELIVFICDFCIQVLDVKRLIVIICPNILLFRILKIPSATPGDNLILWTSAVRSLTGPDSLVGWPQICGCYVISLPPKWGAPWGTLCYHSLIVGPFFRRLMVKVLQGV